MLSARRLYARDIDGRMCDTEGALDEGNSSDTGAKLRRSAIRGRWVA